MRTLLLLMLICCATPVMAKTETAEKPVVDTLKKPTDAEVDKILSGESPRVKFDISVSRFGENSVHSLVSYLFYFQTDDNSTKKKIYSLIRWFKGEITPKLTEYLSNPAHDPKNLQQVKRYMMRLTNRVMNKRFPKKDNHNKPIRYKYITEVFINKVFERKL